MAYIILMGWPLALLAFSWACIERSERIATRDDSDRYLMKLRKS